MLSDNAVFKLQDNLLLWLSSKGHASWQQMKKIILNMIDSYDIDASNAYTEYEVLLPLYQLGIIDVCIVDGKINYFIPEGNYSENQDILPVLKAFPSISNIVSTWEKSMVSNIKYLYSLKNRDFILKDNNTFEYGICKQDNRAWTFTFYKMNKQFYKLPSYDISTEGFRIAKCKHHIDAGHKILEFTNKGINCIITNTIPIPIIRLLYLACPEIMQQKQSRIMNPTRTFPITDKDITNQLRRIFEQKE